MKQARSLLAWLNQMNKIPAQQFLRQQLAFARIHLDAVLASENSGGQSKFREHSDRQAFLLCLEKGICEYIGHLLAGGSSQSHGHSLHSHSPKGTLAPSSHSGSIEAVFSRLQKSELEDYRVKELKSAALGEEGALKRLQAWLSSLYFKPAEWQAGYEGAGDTLDNDERGSNDATHSLTDAITAPVNLIASSAETTELAIPHWTKSPSREFEATLLWLEELLLRHSSNDEEF
ncbi:hypothetical protein TDB9533_03541 [Thalassocella blandensis]|nr:hypothetical protein TDB9533_03541 [Thalassocella blandensis]